EAIYSGAACRERVGRRRSPDDDRHHRRQSAAEHDDPATGDAAPRDAAATHHSTLLRFQEVQMTKRSVIWATAAIAALGLAACKTNDAQAPAPASAGEVSAATPAPST